MKTIFITLAFVSLSAMSVSGQQYDWKNMSLQQRKESIKKMSPEQKADLVDKFREDLLLSELHIPEDKKDDFLNIYAEYQEKQKEIKSKFDGHSKQYDNLSDEEARQQLDKSFDVGQQLLNNRRSYSDKFQRVISPQQVLKLYHTEGMMRSKLMDKAKNGSNAPQRRRP